jgi:hypothetical protein
MADMCARALALPPGMSPATTDLPDTGKLVGIAEKDYPDKL